MDALDPALGLDPAALEALAQGRHGDPFAVLGPHMVDGTRVVRAIAPGANGIEVVAAEDGAALGRLSKVHPSGVFAGRVGSGPYRQRILWEDTIQETEDPYAFGLLLGPLDLHLISKGTHYELGQCLGARPMTIDGVGGVRFAVWAPNARRVSVVGDFNTWDGRRHPMRLRQEAGVWELFVPRLGPGERYKFELIGPDGSLLPQKADPVARASEAAPATASIVAPVEPFPWTDAAWMAERPRRQALDQPMAIYEVHAGSWFRAEDGGFLDWNALGDRLIPYVRDMGFTHLELMPIMEHPFGGSWGYQPLGLFAPTGRFGPPDDFAAFVDRCHAAEIGIILDWVPAHFPTDVYGLARFDGTALYEHEDPREGFHQDWNTLIYNLGRNEVRGFLIASAFEWLERYHVDGIRVDAVASMLYRDYSRAADAWIPNIYGGRENLEAVEFFKHLNSMIPERCPGAITIAEESTAWPKVTAPASEGGLGFTLKWNMGWMHDTLGYMELDPIFRRWHHHALTFGMIYAYSEHFVLPLSHDEVVYGKGSLIRKMPGDDWQKFANLRAYLSFMWSFPGRKLIFMGGEIAQWAEWNHDSAIHWDLLDNPAHKGVQRAMRDLNRLYRRERPLHARDDAPDGFQWVVADDSDASVYAFLRSAPDEAPVLVVANLTPLPRQGYRIGVPHGGWWEEVFNSDAEIYGGSNVGNGGGAEAREVGRHGHPFSVDLTLPPLATIMLRAKRD